jgi:hypothetical protein
VSFAVPVPGADRVIAGLNARFRGCYARVQAVDPTAAGRIKVSLEIEARGDVANASVLTNTGLPAEFANCVVRALKNAQFDPPGAPGSTGLLTLTMKPE